MFELVSQDVLWSIWGSLQTFWSLPLPNITWHFGTWPYTVNPQLIRYYTNLWAYYRAGPYTRFWPCFRRTLQRVRLAYRGRLLLRTPGPVPFRTCICSNVDTIFSWHCHVFELWISSIPRYFYFAFQSFHIVHFRFRNRLCAFHLGLLKMAVRVFVQKSFIFSEFSL